MSQFCTHQGHSGHDSDAHIQLGQNWLASSCVAMETICAMMKYRILVLKFNILNYSQKLRYTKMSFIFRRQLLG